MISYIWLVPLLPAIGILINGFLGAKYTRDKAGPHCLPDDGPFFSRCAFNQFRGDFWRRGQPYGSSLELDRSGRFECIGEPAR